MQFAGPCALRAIKHGGKPPPIAWEWSGTVVEDVSFAQDEQKYNLGTRSGSGQAGIKGDTTRAKCLQLLMHGYITLCIDTMYSTGIEISKCNKCNLLNLASYIFVSEQAKS